MMMLCVTCARHVWASQRMANEAGVRSLRIITYNFNSPLHSIPKDKYVACVLAMLHQSPTCMGHNNTRPCPPPRELHGITTLMSQLRIKRTKFANALRNALMDHHLVERCVLVDNEKEGLRLLNTYQRANVIAWVQCRDGGKCTKRGKSTVRHAIS